MKIVSWNCNGAFRRKYDRIEHLGADVYVIQECEDPSGYLSAFGGWAENYIWSGRPGKKGIGVFVRNGMDAAQLEWLDHGLEHFLPVRVGALNILAVWTKNSRTMPYVGQFWQYLQHNHLALDRTTIICGDLNSNAIWDRRGRIWNHSECVEYLDRLGFQSAYHQCHVETQGRESQPTFYLHRNIEKPYHIDYFFVHLLPAADAPNVVVGQAADWLALSDHMPVTFTA